MKISNENKNNLVRGTLIYAIGNFGTKVLAFLIVPLYTYYISTGDMGDYDLVTTTVSLLTPIMTLRISDATYKWLLHNSDTDKNCISAAYRIILISSVITAAILLIINVIIPIKYCYYFIPLLILGRWTESLQTILRGLKKQRLFVLSGIVQSVVFLGLNVLFIVVMKQGITGMFRSYVISLAVSTILMLCAEPRLRVRIVRKRENRYLTKAMLLYSAPLVPSGLAWWVMGTSDRYVIRFVLGAEANGIYAIANKFPTILSMLFTIFNFSWTDVAIGNLNSERETSEYSSRLFEKLYELAFCFTIPLIPATKIITQIVMSAEYKESSVYISFLYLGALFQGFTTFITAGLLQGTKTGSIAKSSSIGAVINLAVDLLFMKYIGVQAASISTFCGFFVMWILRMRDTKSVAPIILDIKKFVTLFMISLAVAIVVIYTSLALDFLITIFGIILFLKVNKDYVTQIIGKTKKKVMG